MSMDTMLSNKAIIASLRKDILTMFLTYSEEEQIRMIENTRTSMLEILLKQTEVMAEVEQELSSSSTPNKSALTSLEQQVLDEEEFEAMIANVEAKLAAEEAAEEAAEKAAGIYFENSNYENSPPISGAAVKAKPCRFGSNCRYKDSTCTFNHSTLVEATDTNVTICSFWQKGICRNGTKCRFLHCLSK